MIVVSGTLEFAPGHREEVTAAMTRVEAATRQESGCMTYTFYADRDDEQRFRVFEEWESWETLEAHGQSAHIAEFRTTLAGLGLRKRDIKAYEVAETREI